MDGGEAVEMRVEFSNEVQRPDEFAVRRSCHWPLEREKLNKPAQKEPVYFAACTIVEASHLLFLHHLSVLLEHIGAAVVILMAFTAGLCFPCIVDSHG